MNPQIVDINPDTAVPQNEQDKDRALHYERLGRASRAAAEARGAEANRIEFEPNPLDVIRAALADCRHFVGTDWSTCFTAFHENLTDLLDLLRPRGVRPCVKGTGVWREFVNECIDLIWDRSPDARAKIIQYGTAIATVMIPDDTNRMNPELRQRRDYLAGEDFNYLRDANPNMWDEIMISVGIDVTPPKAAAEDDETRRLAHSIIEAAAGAEWLDFKPLATSARSVLEPEGRASSDQSMRTALNKAGVSRNGRRYDVVDGAWAIATHCGVRGGRNRRSIRATSSKSSASSHPR